MNSSGPIFDTSPFSGFFSDPSSVDVAPAAVVSAPTEITGLALFNSFMGVFVVAFMVTLIATPIMRRLAMRYGVIDRPTDPRKVHRLPVAYLGGVAVFLGLLSGVAFSYAMTLIDPQSNPLREGHVMGARQLLVPWPIVFGMMLIMLAGLIDDVVGISPRVKVAMQLVAAAALAMDNIGVRLAAGLMYPLGRLVGNERLLYLIGEGILPNPIQLDLVYWAGTAIIAIFILGACNASNLIDGLDGLCTGVTAIASLGLLLLAFGMALNNDGPLDSARIVMCMALLGACLGFLPYNFNPATIFLGDCGSLLLGFTTIAVVLTLGDTGKTPLVVAGLLVYSLPIIDTTLAIVRRKLSGLPMSAPDDEHLHHQLKRVLGVKGAVFSLYGISGVFMGLGLIVSEGRARFAYMIALVLAAFIGVTAVKIGQRKRIEEQALAMMAAPAKRDPATGSLIGASKSTTGKSKAKSREELPETV